MILCCGEALIDMIPTFVNEEETYSPRVGGAVYNTSVALGRMGSKPYFLGSISNDIFGKKIIKELENSKVNTRLCIRSDFNSTFAFANIKDGTTTYTFIDENSANKNIDIKSISLPDEITTLYIGGILLMNEQSGEEIENFINKESKKKVVFFDPNIRPNLILNREVYMKRFENILTQSDIIKVSHEDLEWLYPSIEMLEVQKLWISMGISIVIITKGSKGAVAKTNFYEVNSISKRVKVIDTIGAGDIFNAAFLFSLKKDDVLKKSSIKKVSSKIIQESLDFANKVAAISVTRVGANPPYLSEI